MNATATEYLWPNWLQRNTVNVVLSTPEKYGMTFATDIIRRIISHGDWPDGSEIIVDSKLAKEKIINKPYRFLAVCEDDSYKSHAAILHFYEMKESIWIRPISGCRSKNYDEEPKAFDLSKIVEPFAGSIVVVDCRVQPDTLTRMNRLAEKYQITFLLLQHYKENIPLKLLARARVVLQITEHSDCYMLHVFKTQDKQPPMLRMFHRVDRIEYQPHDS